MWTQEWHDHSSNGSVWNCRWGGLPYKYGLLCRTCPRSLARGSATSSMPHCPKAGLPRSTSWARTPRRQTGAGSNVDRSRRAAYLDRLPSCLEAQLATVLRGIRNRATCQGWVALEHQGRLPLGPHRQDKEQLSEEELHDPQGVHEDDWQPQEEGGHQGKEAHDGVSPPQTHSPWSS